MLQTILHSKVFTRFTSKIVASTKSEVRESRSIISRLNAIFKQAEIESETHPGGDSMRSFYKAWSSYPDRKDLRNFLRPTLELRPHLSATHIIHLLPRIIQKWLYFKKLDQSYPQWTVNEWEKFFTLLLKDKHLRSFVDTRLKRYSLSTHVAQRYLGVKAVMKLLFLKDDPTRTITYFDAGSSLPIGPRLIEKGKDGFEILISDKTPEKVINKLKYKKVNIARGLALDTQPLNTSFLQWVDSCSSYFKDIESIGNVSTTHTLLEKSSCITYHQGDMLDDAIIYKLPQAPYDITSFVTTLYQYSPEGREIAFAHATRLTKVGGVIIVCDFARVVITKEGNKAIQWYKNWFKTPYRYRTIVIPVLKGNTLGEPQEFLQWENGRCKSVRPGKDYYDLIQTC